MSYDDYEKRLAENTAMDQKREKLRQAVNVPGKDDEFSPRTPEEEARVEKYRQAVQKLVRHNLPDLYSPDHSIYVFQSWYGNAWVVDKGVARECDAVEVGLLQFFGVYGARTEGRRAGCWRMETTRLPDGVKPPTR
jgi:hypothetical protein